jgi:indole-3-glycerol phosphate synthase
MTILDKIVQNKLEELKFKKQDIPIEFFENHKTFERQALSLSYHLKNGSGIISEFKRKSPSKGVINAFSKPEEVTAEYNLAGVSALSVLTDYEFFGGLKTDIIKARSINEDIPILRKDFIVDEYQIFESKALGADVILLIASILTCKQLQEFYELATELGMSVLHEVHSKEELDKFELDNKIIGVNNRDLKTFKVDVNQSKLLSKYIPESCVKVSESGIYDVATIKELQDYGYEGFLIGENFMRTDNPGKECREFIGSLMRC